MPPLLRNLSDAAPARVSSVIVSCFAPMDSQSSPKAIGSDRRTCERLAGDQSRSALAVITGKFYSYSTFFFLWSFTAAHSTAARSVAKKAKNLQSLP